MTCDIFTHQTIDVASFVHLSTHIGVKVIDFYMPHNIFLIVNMYVAGIIKVLGYKLMLFLNHKVLYDYPLWLLVYLSHILSHRL